MRPGTSSFGARKICLGSATYFRLKNTEATTDAPSPAMYGYKNCGSVDTCGSSKYEPKSAKYDITHGAIKILLSGLEVCRAFAIHKLNEIKTTKPPLKISGAYGVKRSAAYHENDDGAPETEDSVIRKIISSAAKADNPAVCRLEF